MINILKEVREVEQREEGFTLIELMIVVVIVGVLAAIAIPIFTTQQRRAIEATVKSDVKNTASELATALVKNPTARYITGFHFPCPGGTANCEQAIGRVSNDGTTDGALIGAPNHASTHDFPLTVSDSNEYIEVGGTWNNYFVLGFYGSDATAGESVPMYDTVMCYNSTRGKGVALIEGSGSIGRCIAGTF